MRPLESAYYMETPRWGGLGKYGSKFAPNGYDDLDLLAELNADEVELLIEVLQPLPGHAAKLRKRLELLPI